MPAGGGASAAAAMPVYSCRRAGGQRKGGAGGRRVADGSALCTGGWVDPNPNLGGCHLLKGSSAGSAVLCRGRGRKGRACAPAIVSWNAGALLQLAMHEGWAELVVRSGRWPLSDLLPRGFSTFQPELHAALSPAPPPAHLHFYHCWPTTLCHCQGGTEQPREEPRSCHCPGCTARN